MTLETDFQNNWRQQGWATSRGRGLVAVSTGVDSMVLLTLLSRLPHDQRPQLTVVHVNHELRAQSTTEEKFLTTWCADHRIPLVTKHWPRAEHPDHGVEAAARDFRYQFFSQQLQQQSADWVATAHQADEQAETILLKLLRGGELAQLAGMANERFLGGGKVIHPLLPFKKTELVAFARRMAIPWYEDATNQELVVSRNRVRHQILPQLRGENPQVIDHLTAYARQLRAVMAVADEALDTKLTGIVEPGTGQENVTKLLARPDSEQRLLLARLIKQSAPTVTTGESHLNQCLQLLRNLQRPSGVVDFSGGWVFRKSYDRFEFTQPKNLQQKSVEQFTFMVDLNQWRSVGNGRLLGFFPESSSIQTPHETVALQSKQFPLQVRQWVATDQLRLASGHHQSVRRALINAKVPRSERAAQLVLVTAQGEVLTVLGVKWSVWPSRAHTKNYHIVLKHE